MSLMSQGPQRKLKAPLPHPGLNSQMKQKTKNKPVAKRSPGAGRLFGEPVGSAEAAWFRVTGDLRTQGRGRVGSLCVGHGDGAGWAASVWGTGTGQGGQPLCPSLRTEACAAHHDLTPTQPAAQAYPESPGLTHGLSCAVVPELPPVAACSSPCVLVTGWLRKGSIQGEGDRRPRSGWMKMGPRTGFTCEARGRPSSCSHHPILGRSPPTSELLGFLGISSLQVPPSCLSVHSGAVNGHGPSSDNGNVIDTGVKFKFRALFQPT